MADSAAPAINPEASKMMSSGFASAVLPTINSLEQQMAEVSRNQAALLDTLSEQAKVLRDNEEFKRVMSTMADVPMYHSKLVGIKKEMVAIIEKSNKMMKRVEKLRGKV
eukprot:gene1323-30756_t